MISGATPDSPLFREEIFGPVLVILPFDSDDEAVRLANDSDYGLSASVWSTNVNRIHATAQKLKVNDTPCK